MGTFIRPALILSGGLQKLRKDRDTLELKLEDRNPHSTDEGGVAPNYFNVRFGPGETETSGEAGVILNLSWLSVQGLRNLPKFLQRFEVSRAPLGVGKFILRGKGNGRPGRVALQIHVSVDRLGFSALPDDGELRLIDGFRLFRNPDGEDVTLQLPAATPARIGLEYFLAVRNSGGGGSVTVQTGRPRDEIVEEDNEGGVTGTGTQVMSSQNQASVVIACRSRRLWVLENASTLGAADTSDWTVS